MARHNIKLLIIGRSDGQRVVEHSKSKQTKEDNLPTKAQLQRKVDSRGVENYYQAIKIGHPKSMEWRKKLGGMLIRQLGKPYDENLEYCLADFPENYRLFEHCRISPESSRLEKDGAKYSNERRDYYLYGHPGGPKKRYRSPADFLPHLLWIATDPEGDTGNCECKVCTPEDLMKLGTEYLQSAQRDEKTAAIKEEPRPGKQIKSAPGSQVEREVKDSHAPGMVAIQRKRSISVKQEDVHSPLTKPVTVAPPAPVVPTAPVVPIVTSQLASPTPLTAPKNYDQAMDAQCNKFLYRPGEVVWFNRGTSWGLAVIVARHLFKDQRHQDRPEYNVQPLSHPYAHPPIMSIPEEDRLRPWLAWSAPNSTHQALINTTLTYETIDWRAVVQHLYGPGDAEVDGSIFAAKMIDGSYTPFEQLNLARPKSPDRLYNGVFCGGEKIWVGEAIRLRTGSEKDLMILHHIVEPPSKELVVIGDIYTFETVPYNPKRPIGTNPYLPLRVQEDLNYRNRATIAKRSQISFWKLTQASARLSLGDVKGRWYESRVLLPIIQGQASFAQSLSRGEISDVGDKLNGRGDSTGTAKKHGMRKADRLDAFGASVPPTTSIEEVGGRMVPVQPVSFPMDPALSASSSVMQIDQAPDTTVNDADMSEFVDVNQMDEGDYSQEYLGQLGNGGQF